MERYRVCQFSNARSLQKEWDELAGCYFQKKDFLQYTEQYNPCRQRYYAFFQGEAMLAGAVVYTLRIDLLTFSHIPSPVSMQVIGLPASVSAPGFLGADKDAVQQLIHYILKREHGLILGLNLAQEIDPSPAVSMNMLPGIELEHTFSNWPDYLSQLRSPYRRRVMQLQERFREVETQRTSCQAFTPEHHRLYLDILQRTDSKLEVLSEAFFRNLPDNFYLVSCWQAGRLLCWHINCEDEGRLFFFFGGHDYNLLPKFQSYFNNLLCILRRGIEDGFSAIDFGQTAEVPKLKLGASVQPKAMFLYHRNPLLLWLLQKGKRWISYRSAHPEVHVFKQPLAPATMISTP